MNTDARPTTKPLPLLAREHLTAAKRVQINRELSLLQNGLAVAVNHPPGGRRSALTIVKLRRGTAGKPPRRGVMIPPASTATPRLARTGRHARQQHRDGKFGNKGEETIERKQELIRDGQIHANAAAAERRARRRNQTLRS